MFVRILKFWSKGCVVDGGGEGRSCTEGNINLGNIEKDLQWKRRDRPVC